jgi:serine phosphatase RsbU (regulator of sigma subunit)
MAKPLQVLVIEDSEGDAQLMLWHLRRGGFTPEYLRVDTAETLASALAGRQWDIILSDHNMPQFSSTAALEIVKASRADIPFIIVSDSIGEEMAVEAMKAGAQDYLMKGNLTRLVAAVERELKDAADRRARMQAERTLLAQAEAMRIAREVQGRLFPSSPPAIATFDIAGDSCPADATGGDYYDFIRTPRQETFIVVGDVTGHGIGPALLMADVRAYLRALVPEYSDIQAVLSRANRLLREDLGDFRFITLLCAGLFPDTRSLRYINAGHPPGYVLDGTAQIKRELPSCAPALGLDPEAVFPAAIEVVLEPSDMVLFLTDGALEAAAPSGEEFGLERVLDSIRRTHNQPARMMIASLFDSVRGFADGSRLQDDLTAVIIKTISGGKDGTT